MIRIGLCMLAFSFAAAVLPAQDSDADMVKRVNKAIDKGKAALLRLEAGKGDWEARDTTGVLLNYGFEFTGGTTALCTLALLNCGMTADDDVIKRSLKYLRTIDQKKTYVVSLIVMALAEARQPQDLELIRRHVDWLFEKAVWRGGKLIGWHYPSDGNVLVDGSNTQYALLALYAAKQAGIKIDDDKWNAIRTLYIDAQKSNSATSGHWTYGLGQTGIGNTPASFTMTVAGVCGLLISGMGLNESQQQLNDASGVAARCGRYEINGPVAKGLNWIAADFSFDGHSKKRFSIMYNVYGLERLGRLSGQRFIGDHDWYREGCKFLVDDPGQKPDGTWTRDDQVADKIPAISTSFALLFLSKGRMPILISKFAHGNYRVPRGKEFLEADENGIVAWNRKQNDTRNLTEFVSRELFNGLPMGWQVYDSRRSNFSEAEKKTEVEALLACPVMYMNGHGPIVLTKQQEEILKRYVDEGGFLFAEACCGDNEFAQSFHKLMRKLFPDNELNRMRPEHPIWNSFFQVSPAEFPFVDAMERGCKTVVVFTQSPMAGYWEESRFAPAKGKPAANRGQRAWQFAGNVIAYATGMQAPEQRGTRRMIAGSSDVQPPRGAFKPAQLMLPDETPPAPAAMRNLVAHVAAATNIDTANQTQKIRPLDPEISKFKFVYMHGRRKFALDGKEIANLKLHLETDGTLFADAACGKKEFDESFRALMTKMFPDKKLEVIPPGDDLYSETINGKGQAVRTVKRREKAGGDGPDGGYKELPPHLEGIKIDGRWAVIYSKWDVGCALEKHNSTECLGHTPDSALKLGMAAVLYSLKR